VRVNVAQHFRGKKPVKRHDAPGLGQSRRPGALDKGNVRQIAPGQGDGQFLNGHMPLADKPGLKFHAGMS
jgi:hypothetical protein